MPVEQRQHIRFSLDIPAIRHTKYGEAVETLINQISIGGCLIELDESIYVGDEFRLLIPLPNKNFLPLACKALYRASDNEVGAKFLDITRFEQELLAKVISQNLKKDGLPLQVDPFALPLKSKRNDQPQITDPRVQKDSMIEKILSSEF